MTRTVDDSNEGFEFLEFRILWVPNRANDKMSGFDFLLVSEELKLRMSERFWLSLEIRKNEAIGELHILQ